MRVIFMLMALAVLLAPHALAAGPQTTMEVERITVDELKARLDAGDRIVVLDVRSPGSYSQNAFKIKGSVRMAPSEAVARASEIPMGREIVTYCT
jgi:rhodanese-related sulfurtransferase